MLRTLTRGRPPLPPVRVGSGTAVPVRRRTLVAQAICHGPSEPPLLEQTIGEHFNTIVAAHGDRTALISQHQNARLTYDALDRDSNALARGLANRGVVKGDRVAVSLGNNVEYATLTYALAKLGAILVPLNPAFTATQVVAALTHLEVKHLVIGTETKLSRKEPRSNVPLLAHLIPNLGGPKVDSELVPSLANVVVVDNSCSRVALSELKSLSTYASVAEDGGDGGHPLSDQGLDRYDVASIQFTSGTTSMPKAACLTHRSMLNNGKSVGDRMRLTPDDVVCCPPPLFHVFGSVIGYMACATHASALVFPSECFDGVATLRALRDERCTALHSVPTMFIEILTQLSAGALDSSSNAEPAPDPPPSLFSFPSDPPPPTPPPQTTATLFPHLRTGVAAGSPVPSALMRKLHATLNLTELTICYGMAELSPVCAMTRVDDPLARRVDSVGRLLPHVSAKVVDPAERGRVMDVGERGELAVAGYLAMTGYWGDGRRTEEAMVRDAEGVVWMHTGDEASIDAAGYIRITGRIKDLIIKGGENVHPLAIEDCLLAHSAVADASVVGLPDARYGEAVAAFVVRHQESKIDANEVREFVRERLGRFLVPKYVFWVDTYPKTASGKIQKFKLREEGARLVERGEGLA